MLRHDCIVCCPQPELAVLVAPKGIQIAAVCHCKSVRVAARYLHNVTAAEGRDCLRYEDIVAVSMPQPTKVSPAEA